MRRESLLGQITAAIKSIECTHPTRVAIDGIDAAGKTTLADELATALGQSNRQIIRASADDFLNTKETRYRRGPLSPQGYFNDSLDHDAILASVLSPLGPGGNRCYRLAGYDLSREAPVEPPPQEASPRAILLFDGIFLTQPALREHWDYKIFVHVSLATSTARGVQRDQDHLGGEDTARERYARRYVPGQQIYLDRCKPSEHADVVINNEDPEHPQVIWKD
ncbi:hypothetical protein ACFL6M_02890 [Candidatus Eisenbacteria bacterium]|uniref:Phosphoribulokinase/uridine kinase domain-containing protein n=1 Tax=Eiseniibacteriota bacterium TaxID=2212470 RepID=A0ABV6YK29_UNCEI